MDAMEESKYTKRAKQEVVLQKKLLKEDPEKRESTKQTQRFQLWTRSVTAPFLTFLICPFRMFIQSSCISG